MPDDIYDSQSESTEQKKYSLETPEGFLEIQAALSKNDLECAEFCMGIVEKENDSAVEEDGIRQLRDQARQVIARAIREFEKKIKEENVESAEFFVKKYESGLFPDADGPLVRVLYVKALEIVSRVREFDFSRIASQEAITIRCVSEYLSKFVRKISREYNSEQVYDGRANMIAYRGESKDYDKPDGKRGGNNSFKPSVFREGFETKETFFYKEMERLRPADFLRMSNFDKLCKMQHHSLPTRLLDLTTNPLVALYFACCSNEEKDGFVKAISGNFYYSSEKEIQMLSLIPEIDVTAGKALIFGRLLRFFSSRGLIDEKSSDDCDFLARLLEMRWVGVMPNNLNERLKIQKGLFLLFGFGLRKEDEEKIKVDDTDIYLQADSSLRHQNKLTCIIPGKKKKEILEELESLGIDGSTLMTDIDSAAIHMRKRHTESLPKLSNIIVPDIDGGVVGMPYDALFGVSMSFVSSGYIAGPIGGSVISPIISKWTEHLINSDELDLPWSDEAMLLFQGSGIQETDGEKYRIVTLPMKHTAFVERGNWLASIIILRELSLRLRSRLDINSLVFSMTGLPVNAGIAVGYAFHKNSHLKLFFEMRRTRYGSVSPLKRLSFEKESYPQENVPSGEPVDMCVYIHAKNNPDGKVFFDEYIRTGHPDFHPSYPHIFKYINEVDKFDESTDLIGTADELISDIRKKYSSLQEEYGASVRLHLCYNGFIGLALMLGHQMPQTFNVFLHDYDGVSETYRPALCLNRDLFQEDSKVQQ